MANAQVPRGPEDRINDIDVRIGQTHVGKGVFAQRIFQTNWVIGEIQGELIHDPKYTSEYCFDLEDGCMLEPQPPLRYVNHSCEPNCEFNWFDVTDTGELESRRRVFLIALREIKPGEELTIDYNWPIESAIPCRCRAPSCRGWIVVPGELEALIATKVPRHGKESLHVGSRDS